MGQVGGMDGARLEGVMTNLNSVLQRAAADHGKRAAVRMDGLVLRYFQLWEAAGRMASGKILRREVQPPEELR